MDFKGWGATYNGAVGTVPLGIGRGVHWAAEPPGMGAWEEGGCGDRGDGEDHRLAAVECEGGCKSPGAIEHNGTWGSAGLLQSMGRKEVEAWGPRGL